MRGLLKFCKHRQRAVEATLRLSHLHNDISQSAEKSRSKTTYLNESVEIRRLRLQKRLQKRREKRWRAAKSNIDLDDEESNVIDIEESNNDDDTLRRSSDIENSNNGDDTLRRSSAIDNSNNDDDTLRRSSRIKRPSLKVRESEESGCIQLETAMFQLKDRKKQRLLIEIDNNINKDAKNYQKELEKMTRFVICGVCGIEDSCSKMLPIRKCIGAIKACDELSSAYARKTSISSQYSMDVTHIFNEYGLLRIAEFVCKACHNKLKNYSKHCKAMNEGDAFGNRDEDESNDIIIDDGGTLNMNIFYIC